MSRFRKLTHSIWHFQYHVVWVPKYRYRVLQGVVGDEVRATLLTLAGRMGVEVVELSVMADHEHLVGLVPPTLAVSKVMGELKGRTAIRVFQKHRYLRKKPYYGNHFWAKGYCVDTVGVDEEMIRRYVRWQEKRERREEDQLKLDLA